MVVIYFRVWQKERVITFSASVVRIRIQRRGNSFKILLQINLRPQIAVSIQLRGKGTREKGRLNGRSVGITWDNCIKHVI